MKIAIFHCGFVKTLSMNDSKIDEYLLGTSDLDKDLPRRRSVPIVFADSKGRYLENESKRKSSNIIERNIIWKNKGGRTALNSIDWLKTQIINYRRYYGNFELFIFLGTCDLSVKDSDGIIHLLPKLAKIEEKLISKFRNFAHYARIKGFPVTFLEIPAICMQEWNRQHGHENPESFAEDDKDLNSVIEKLNKNIRRLNRENGKLSPNFNSALLKTRKNKSKKKNKYRPTFSLYKDGIHSNQKLSQYWLRKLAEIVKKQCY